MIAKEVRRKSSRSKALRRKNVRRKNVGRKTLRRKNVGRKTLRRKNVKRKTMRRKNMKRKTMRKGGNFILDRFKKCIGMDCGGHIGELSTDSDGLKLVVTDYEPPPEGFNYYYEEPFEYMGELNESAAQRLAIIIAQIKYKDSWRGQWENLKSALLYTTYIKKKIMFSKNYFVNKYLDAGLYDNGFRVLPLLATKLLRYFKVEDDVDRSRRDKGVVSDNDNIPPNQQLKVVYKKEGNILHTVGEQTSLDMKMKSQSEEENKELFNRGTAHMIAYLIYNYESLNEKSEVSSFINWVKNNEGFAEYIKWEKSQGNR